MLHRLRSRSTSLLLDPKHTLHAIIVGCTALGTALAAQVAAITPLANAPLISPVLKGHVIYLEGLLTTISIVCLVIAGCGRSIVQLIDNNGQPPSSTGQ
jgi:F0F1-type ATP synthase membrane subunit c/vacuolar-type H+-ATPase subunit K